jgi:isopentenyl diphosphate isomerase/L-lactate dehydrogenase-like FMN-dependent dehydrogenase
MTDLAAPPAPVPTASPALATLGEIHQAALARLSPEVGDYLEGGAGQEISLRRNRAAFERWAFKPRNMSGALPSNTESSFMGIPLSLPVLTAPFGGDGLFHPEGQLAVRRANRRFGTASIVPEAGSHSLEANAAEAPGTQAIGQLHPMGTEANFLDVVARYERAGYSALCVTVDCPTAGWRERNKTHRWSPPKDVLSGNYPSSSDAMKAAFGQLFTHDEPVWSWEYLGGLLANTRLPWMAKGILTVEDAQSAVAVGASALLVSNHGGRQLDSVIAPIDALPAIRAVVGDDIEIALDSGIRSGSDVLKALSLGADAVIIGRLAIYGLTADGEDGVVRTLELLAAEMRQALPLIGKSSVRDLGRDNMLDLREVY